MATTRINTNQYDGSPWVPLTQKGLANGVASLDANGKVPSSQLPSEFMSFKGSYDAAQNIPALQDGIGDPGDVYRVGVAGNRDFGSGIVQQCRVGDWVMYNGSQWQVSSGTSGVLSFNGRAGDVSLTQTDVNNALGYTPYNASNPAGYISASYTGFDTRYPQLTGSYSNPSWITSLAYSKLTGVPTSLPPSGTAGGDLTGTYPNPTLVTVNSNTGTFGSSTQVGTFTVNGKGLITAASNVAIAFPVTSVFGRTGAVVAQQSDYSTYFPLKDGTGATGTWPISITGNATQWNTNTYSASDHGVALQFIMGQNGATGNWSYYTLDETFTWLQPQLDAKYARLNGSNASGVWPISITGNAATANSWGGRNADLTSSQTPAVGVVTIGGDGITRYSNDVQIKAWLGMPSGGETLQTVTTRGATTTNPTLITPTANSAWALQVTNSGTTDAHGLYVNIGSTSTGTPFRVDKNAAAQFIVTNGGSVGIGTDVPARQVEQSANGAVEYLMTDVSQGTNLKRWRIFNSAQQLKFGTLSDDASTALDVMALTRDGNVLVGSTTTSTNEKVQIFTGGNRGALAVFGNSASNVLSDLSITRSSSNAGVGQSAAIQLNDNSVGNGYGYIIQGGIGGLQFFNSANVTGSNWIERMRITPSGSVLIGTTTLSEASVKMDVAGPIRSSNQSIDAGISVVGDAGPNGRSFIQTDTYAGGAAKDLDINPFGGVVYIPNSSVVIGNTAPPSGVLLNVNGKSRQLGFQIFNPNGSTNGKGWEWAPATGTDIMNFNILNDAGGVLGTAMSFQRSGTTLTGIYMGGSAGGTWLSLANGAASFNGTVSGSDAVSNTQFVTKQQLDAASVPTTGTWTPSFTDVSPITVNSATYIRTGATVIVTFDITIPSSSTTGSPASCLTMVGLPVFGKNIISNTSNLIRAGVQGAQVGVSATASFSSSTNHINFGSLTSNACITNSDAAGKSPSYVITGSVTYVIN